MKPVLIIHGGAGGKIPTAQRREILLQSLEQVLTEVYPLLQVGKSALTAVVHAVRLLEDDPLYNAGKGSAIQSDGRIRMSAALMDGDKRRFSGCVNVEGIKNPIRLAQRLLPCKDRVLSGRGAEKFAREAGLPFASPFTPKQRKRFELRKGGKSGTVGALALDNEGRLAAATSTGGRGFEYPFRVSDSPTVAGCFANSVCAASATGIGEQIVEFAAASTICAYVDCGLSLASAVERLFKQGGKAQIGVITLDATGNYLAKTATPYLVWAAADGQDHHFMR